MTKVINLDCDGTFINLYGVNGWLDNIINEEVRPYREAKPLVNLAWFARTIHELQNKGWKVNIISWTAKNGTKEYNARVTEAKLKWLDKHLPSVMWDRITIVKYGTPKENYCENPLDILFDDEEKNRESWTGVAYDVNDILGVLKAL